MATDRYPGHHRLLNLTAADLQRRPEYRQKLVGEWEAVCAICEIEQREHINNVYCPEWRLRQLDGDR